MSPNPDYELGEETGAGSEGNAPMLLYPFLPLAVATGAIFSFCCRLLSKSVFDVAQSRGTVSLVADFDSLGSVSTALLTGGSASEIQEAFS